jgi:YbbR domain-containing protein
VYLQGSRITGSDIRELTGKIWEKLHSWGIFLSFFIALALWFYVSLNNQYTTYITVPLDIQINEDLAIENIIKPNIQVEVRATGWELFNLIYLNNSKMCVVDLRNLPQGTKLYELTYSKLSQSFISMEKAEIRKTNPENIRLQISEISKKTVPIRPDISLLLRKGFTLVGDIELDPDTAEIKGFGGILDSISSVATVSREFSDVYTNISQKIPIKDTLPKIVKIKPKETSFKANVQLKSGLTIEQIPVIITNGELPVGHQIMPKYIKIYIEGGVEELANLDITSIVASVSQSKISNDSIGLIIPNFNLPKNLKLVSSDPPYLYHFIRKAEK